MTTPQIQPKRGIVKQVLSGDSVIIRGTQGAPPPEKQLNFSSIIAPKLARRATENNEVTKDEPFAWEAREFLRKKLIGEEIWFTSEKPPNTTREYGVIYLGKDFSSAENITKSLVSEGLVTVRREGVRMTPEIEELIEQENAAKAACKGKWGSNLQEHVRDIKWSLENMKNFVDKQGGKPIKAVIEHVRDGSTVRAFLLPDFYHITLMISGVRCNGFKLDANGKPDPNEKLPFADEARYFVEIRLLQRDVEIILESVNNNNFVGTILHPKGNIAEALLKEGLARCVDWSIAVMTSGADRLRTAEKRAKELRLRLWKDWQSNAPQITGREKEFTGTVVEVINGDALLVKLANGQVKKIFLSSIRPPKEASRANDEEGRPVGRPKGFRPLYDIPWMFEAREFLRKKLVDKKVQVVVDYIQEAKDSFPEKVCATVTIGGSNVAEVLVSKGLATVVKYRQDDDQRSSHYDELLAAENSASKSQKGVHDKKKVPVHRIIEIDAAKSKQYLSSFKRANRIDAIVEFVASGSRLRLYIPKETCLCTFLLGGISCPRGARPAMGGIPASVAEPFGEEALTFTKDRCMQKEVQVQIESTDKAGNFIGWLWVDNNNLSVTLVEEGFAAVHPTADRSDYYKQLKRAEDSAKQRKLRRWKDYVEEKEEEQQKIEDDNAMALKKKKRLRTKDMKKRAEAQQKKDELMRTAVKTSELKKDDQKNFIPIMITKDKRGLTARKKAEGKKDEVMSTALEMLRDGNSVGSVSQRCNIPRSILRNLNKSELEFEDEENLLIDQLLLISNTFHGLTLEELRLVTNDLAKKMNMRKCFNQTRDTVVDELVMRFRKRNPTISLRDPEAKKIARIENLYKREVLIFFKNLQGVLNSDKFPAERVYNMDEITICRSPGKDSVQTPIQLGCKKEITAVCSFNASGGYISPMVVFPRKQKTSLMEKEKPGEVLYSCFEKGWSTESFLEWLTHFKKYTCPTFDRPVLLLLDNHETHISLASYDYCRENHISIIVIPTHSSHFLQPLELTFCEPLQYAFSKKYNKFIQHNPNQKVTLDDIATSFKKAFGKVANVDRAVSGFSKSGIYPLEPIKIKTLNDRRFMIDDIVMSTKPKLVASSGVEVDKEN